MKISTLIKALQELKKEKGDNEVLFSSDPEGNSYAELGKTVSFDMHNGKILIFPENTISACEIGL